MIEVTAGIFVGRLSALVRDKLWKKIIERKREGGAAIVQVKDNEQHFDITMDGFPGRSVVDFDGMQLVRVKPGTEKSTNAGEGAATGVPDDAEPSTKRKRRAPKAQDTIGTKIGLAPPANGEGIHPETQDATTSSVSPSSFVQKPSPLAGEFAHSIAHISTSPDFPEGFVERSITASMCDGEVEMQKEGKSASQEHPAELVWQPPWMVDVGRACARILDAAGNEAVTRGREYLGKRVTAIDIETTNYMPKARQGFVNIIGVASIDFTRHASGSFAPELHVDQVFNTLRKRDLVPALVNRAWQHLAGADILLVFNKDFDIQILQSLIDQHGLECKMPPVIVDMMESFPSLAALEQSLQKSTGFQRLLTQKGKYDEYYALFKGTEPGGKGKRLEPIGAYNLIDTLTPLLYYILTRKDP
jgi:CRISPR-associated protein Cas2